MRYGWFVGGMMLLGTVGPVAGQGPSGYVPHRVYDGHAKKFVDFETMTARLARFDVVVIGEEHDDPATHRMELALLESIGRRRDSVAVSLEMFERDAQLFLDRYLNGAMPESLFLVHARPWPRYQTDYRGLVELARERRWPVVAANVPRPIATMVARGGFESLDTLAADSKPLLAGERQCPVNDDYAKAFWEELKGPSAHGGGSAADLDARIGRMYLAQCLKDETMSESVVRAATGRLVIHYTGSFHSDYRRGTAERIQRRNGNLAVGVVSFRPVADLDQLDPKPARKRGDYLIYVLKPPAEKPAAEPAKP